jgi:hypothetical protein
MTEHTTVYTALIEALDDEIAYLRDGYDTVEHGIANSLTRVRDALKGD